jgi:PilZ domain
MEHTVIALSPEESTLRPIEPILQRSSFEVHRVRGVEPVIELCRTLPSLDLLIASLPLDTSDVSAFVGEVRRLRTPRPPLMLLLARNNELESLARIPDEHLQVLSLDNSPEELQREILVRFGRRPRIAQRVLVRLEVHLEIATVFRACQTVNLSETGMLVRTSELFPISTMAQYSLLLEDDPRAVQGMAEVVRHADLKSEKMRGVGLRFLRYLGDGQERLQAYLSKWRAA